MFSYKISASGSVISSAFNNETSGLPWTGSSLYKRRHFLSIIIFMRNRRLLTEVYRAILFYHEVCSAFLVVIRLVLYSNNQETGILTIHYQLMAISSLVIHIII